MSLWEKQMAAETQRLMDSPLVKMAIKVAQSLAGALLLAFCQSAASKLDGIQTSINGFSKDIALVQRDVTQFKSTQDAQAKDLSDLQKTVLRQGFDLGQVRKELDARGR